MKTYKKSVPKLEIEMDYIQKNLKEFLEWDGIECDVYSDDNRSIFFKEDFREKKGINARVGYNSGNVYLAREGYPIFSEGYTNLKINILDDATIKNVKTLIDIYNEGIEYSYILLDDEGEEEASCHGFYNLEAIKELLPEEWKDEDLTKYVEKTW